MDMLLWGILQALKPEYLAYATAGSLLGTFLGVLPGLGPLTAIAVLFPFTAFLPPTGMIICLAAIYYGATYGGSTTAILINVPGEISSVATALDGYEMTKQGRPGPPLAIAAIVSFLAGIAGTVLISILGPHIARWALTFGPAEYLGLGLFSLTAVAAVSGRSLLRGAIVTVVGLLLVTVGVDEGSNTRRLTFGSLALYQGLDIVPVMVGLFGVSEMLRLYEKEMSSAGKYVLGSLMPTLQELRVSLIACARATAVAFPLGILPGMVPSITSFIAYSVERQAAKEPERFGKGAIEGVAAAEAANNAAAMAGLLPVLTLGIPTGVTAALMLAALVMCGLVPGPLLFTQQAEFTWTVIGSFYVANVILLVLNLPLVGLWARLTAIPQQILAPTVLVLCLVGSYATRSSMVDLWVCLASGFVGWALSRRNWPLAPMVLAYVLGPLIESNARRVLAVSPELLLHRPVFWVFIGLAVVAISLMRRFLQGRVVAGGP